MRANEPEGASLSMAELLHQLSTQTTTLVRQELELVRAEISQKGKIVGESAGLFAGSTLFALGAFGALTVTFIAVLSQWLQFWLAALIVTVVYTVIAMMTALTGKKCLQKLRSPVPEQTAQSVRSDLHAVRRGIDHGR